MQFIPYLPVGFPEPDAFVGLFSSFLGNPCVPFVEAGLPALHPYLDGKTIRSVQRQLQESGLTFKKALEFLVDKFQGEQARKIILMGYLRDLTQFGVEVFEEQIRNALFGGMILIGRRREVFTWSTRMTIPLVPVVTVRDTERDLRPFFEKCPPFLYFRVSGGKTGEGGLLPLPMLKKPLEKLRASYPGIPVFAGFGVRDAETARRLREIGFSGVVVGSILLEMMLEKRSVEDFLHELEVL